MVHLAPLPGSPAWTDDGDVDRDVIRDRAVEDARRLAEGGVDGLLVENLGDAPHYPEEVPRHTVAEMTAVTRAVVEATTLPVGVNVLRNGASAAVSVAAAAGASFVRVPIHVGARVSTEGVIEGRAHETLRLRDRIDADVAVLADVAVKYSRPLGGGGYGGATLAGHVADCIDRGRADAVAVTGQATGEAIDIDRLRRAVSARDDARRDVPVFVASGVTAESVAGFLSVADGVVVGSAFKPDGDTAAPVDAERVRSLVAAARSE
jgi:hypothetical protein